MDMTKRLSEILSLNLDRKHTSVSYAIMIDGKIVAADALGHDGTKEKNPVTLNHTYNVCSISKIFCTVAVMKLVEQGKVELDRPICEYLPQFTMLDPRYRQITVRHCLNHSSGNTSPRPMSARRTMKSTTRRFTITWQNATSRQIRVLTRSTATTDLPWQRCWWQRYRA